ncbi:restriction endonuclease subunit S [Niveispirillum sp.]|uniref:restriction endonuclease subunit S n=1 Tax=Niveispirillum sp. TaxID=1917217 RepID=UPI001B5471E8|nr:restriction endonuclease subunit S [Niveispirillum sp.]MBP7338929.1 restriction endonuclease subunit S [Niveispirillum sp.]
MSHFSEIPLPPTWATAPIEKVAEINPGLKKSGIDDRLAVAFVPMPAVEAESGRMDVSATRPFGEVKKGYTAFCEGDILFAKITPCMENGKMAVVPALRNGLGFGSTEFHVLRPRKGISAQYLYYFVSAQQFRRDAEHNMTGAVGQRRVPMPYLAQHSIPIPPEPEQRRIVAKIEELFSELDKGVENLTIARKQLKAYRQAILKAAFEGKLCNASIAQGNSWTARPLGGLIEFLTSGSRGWADYYSKHGDIFIRAQNLKHDRLDLTDIAYVRLPQGNTEGVRTRVRQGDVLITITGANVTKTGLVDTELGPAYVSQHVALCRLTDDLQPEFLYWYLLSEAGGRRQLNEAAYGAGKPGLSLENIRNVVVPVPSVCDQKLVVSEIKRLIEGQQQTDAEIEVELARAEALRQSILKRAFSGLLVAQDSEDEPASVLLERIRAEHDEGRTTKRRNNKNGKKEAA